MTVSAHPVEQDDLRGLVDLVLQGAEANERPDLVRRMRTAAGELAASQPPAPIAATVSRALQSLEIDLRSRRAALADPGRGARMTAESQHAETRLREFQERAARWPRLLGDALSATDSDVEFAVQTWLRALLDEGTAKIESGGTNLDRWLRERMTTEAEACHRALCAAAPEIAGRIAASLELTGPAPAATLDLEPPGELVTRLHRGPRPPADGQPLATRLISILMPAYSGMMVALVVPRLFGLGMPVWVTVTVAVAGAFALGGAALTGERERQRTRRKAEETGNLRSTVDAFRMAVSKQVRDSIRSIEQQLHAGFSEAVNQRTRLLSRAADARRQAVEDCERTPQALTEIDLDL
jgi:hypothetical protein